MTISSSCRGRAWLIGMVASVLRGVRRSGWMYNEPDKGKNLIHF